MRAQREVFMTLMSELSNAGRLSDLKNLSLYSSSIVQNLKMTP